MRPTAAPPLSDADWAEAEVRWHGTPDATDAGTLVAVESREALGDGLVHLAFVLDYSSSMREGELRAQSALMRALLRGFPGTRWGKVLFFTESVQPRLFLTDDLDDVEAALGHDPEASRGSTALWDAAAQAAEALAAGDAVIRLLVVSTDGKDNASTEWDAGAVADFVDAEGIGVVVVASLLADRRALRQFADRNGFFVYGRNLESTQAQVGTALAALVDIQRLRVPVPPSAQAVSVALGEARAAIRLPAGRR